MDDKYIFYLVIGIAYFLFNMLRKKQPKGGANEDTDRSFEQTTRQQSPKRQLTFEELLKEISEGKPAKPQPVTQYVDYDDNLQDEEQDLEDVNIDYSKTDRTIEIYERAKKEAFARPSLETEAYADSGLTFGKFKEFDAEQKETLLDRYTRELRDPEGFKKAFILSEVLNRKHF